MVGITGLGSGIDIDSIVSAMVNAERAPKQAQLTRLESATTAKISSLGTLTSAINKFQTAVKGLNDTALFENRKATSSDATRVTVTADKNASAGVYSVEVEKLATGSKIASGGVSGGSGAIFAEGGTLNIGMGSDSYPIEIADGATLKDIRDSINSRLQDKGITANIVTDPSSSQSRLVLSSSKTGLGKDLTMTSSAPGLAPLTSSQQIMSTASDAEFKIDGLSLKSPTNTISDAIEGLSFDLVSAEVGKTTKLTVADDTSKVKTNIQNFVDAYNALMETTKTLTTVLPVNNGGAKPVVGNLVGDATVRNLLTGMRSELGSPSKNGEIRMLADLGITTQRDGTLKIETAKLDKVIKENYNAIGSFFTGDQGLMNRMNARVDGYVKTGGILQQRTSSLNQTLSGITDQKAALDTRIASIEKRLYSQYNAMDSLVGQLSQTSTWLSGQLTNLPGVVRKS